MVFRLQTVQNNHQCFREGGDTDLAGLHHQTLAAVQVSNYNSLIHQRPKSDVQQLCRYLNMTINPTSGILKQDGALAFRAVASNAIGHEIAFDFLQGNIKEIAE